MKRLKIPIAFRSPRKRSYIRLDQNENPDGVPQWLFESVMDRVTPEFLSIYPEETVPTMKYARMLGLEKEKVTFTDGARWAWDISLKFSENPGKIFFA